MSEDVQISAIVAAVIVLVAAIITGGLVADAYVNRGQSDRARIVKLEARVRTLERACIPTDTGGGVTQCRQPTMREAEPTP